MGASFNSFFRFSRSLDAFSPSIKMFTKSRWVIFPFKAPYLFSCGSYYHPDNLQIRWVGPEHTTTSSKWAQHIPMGLILASIQIVVGCSLQPCCGNKIPGVAEKKTLTTFENLQNVLALNVWSQKCLMHLFFQEP